MYTVEMILYCQSFSTVPCHVSTVILYLLYCTRMTWWSVLYDIRSMSIRRTNVVACSSVILRRIRPSPEQTRSVLQLRSVHRPQIRWLEPIDFALLHRNVSTTLLLIIDRRSANNSSFLCDTPPSLPGHPEQLRSWYKSNEHRLSPATLLRVHCSGQLSSF